MDWIHCNNCYTQLEPGITLYLTSCGHMFCNNCLDNGVQEGTCLVCKVPCSVMKLAPDMNHEIQDYFTDPDDILQKCCEVLQFQRRHRRRLLSYLVQSTKKFYGARTELKRMTELCQKQHKQLREYQKIIKSLESQLSAQPRQTSPFNVPISPGNNVSPNFLQTTPNYKRARSTPYSQPFQSNLVTPTRIIKNRTGNMSAQSQSTSPKDAPVSEQTVHRECVDDDLLIRIEKSNNSNKISSTVFTPPTPESAGLFSSQSTTESGYSTSGSWKRSPSIVYCNGYAEKCAFKRLKR